MATMQTTSNRIKQCHEKIMHRWELSAKAQLPAAREQDRPALRNHIPNLLNSISEALVPGAFPRQVSESKEIAKEHGGQRTELSGYSVAQVLTEYNLLRKIIIEVLDADVPLNIQEREVINDIIAAAIIEAGAEFARIQQNEETRFREEVERHLAESIEAEKKERILADVSLVLTSSFEYEITLKKIAELIVPKLATWCIINLLVDHAIQRVAVVHSDPKKAELARKLQEFTPNLAARGGVAGAIREGRTIVFTSLESNDSRQDIDSRFLSTEDPRQMEIVHELGVKSYISVMMKARGKILGGITLVAGPERSTFQKEDVMFAEKLADRAAIAIDNARLYKEVQEAVEVREDVVSIVSHDLKNPLTSILMNAELLLRMTPTNESGQKIKSQVERINRSAERMQTMIDDILDVAKMAGGTFAIETHTEQAQMLIEEAVELHKSLAEEKSIALSMESEQSCRPVRCDHHRTLQVLSNLLGNAIKFTPYGGSVVAHVEEKNGVAQFSVRDTGPGIAEDQLSHIFERFWQGQDKHKGAGLGLFIAKSIVETHGGRIWVESNQGTGATFYFTLPLAKT